MTVRAEHTVAAPVPVEAIEPGDVLLVRSVPGEPLGRLITTLDRSPYAHAGIALGNGLMMSARQSLVLDGRIDVGGLRVDPLEHFWRDGRSIHRLPVDDPARRARALGFAARVRGTSDGEFSVPKTLLIAGALWAADRANPEVTEEERARLLPLITAAGAAWVAPESEPAYYCAEFVAAAFGATFRLDDLTPPGVPAAPVLPGLGGMRGRAASGLLALGATPEQRRTLGAFVAEMERCDRGFVGAVAMSVLLSMSFRTGWGRGPRPVESDGDHLDPSTTAPGTGPVLPASLVTPRMLRDAAWTGTPQHVVPPPGAFPGAEMPSG